MPSKYWCVQYVPGTRYVSIYFATFNFDNFSGRQEMSVKSKRRHYWKNWNEWNSNPGARARGRSPSWWTLHLEVDQKYYLRQKKVDGYVHPVLDSLDDYKILSERMNVLEKICSTETWNFFSYMYVHVIHNQCFRNCGDRSKKFCSRVRSIV